MVGFEVTKNGKHISGSINKGILSVYAFINDFPLSEHGKSICFFGSEKDSNDILYWLEEELEEGDEIIIELKDIQENSQAEYVKKQEK